MKYSSNFDDPGAFFDEALKDFGLDSPSREGSTVGGRAVKTIATGIYERGERREGPDGRWRDNAASTIKRKGRNDPNHDTNEMLKLEQIMGDVAVTRREADMVYGKDDENKAKAHWAHEGHDRPFMAITESDADAVMDGLCDDIINNFARG